MKLLFRNYGDLSHLKIDMLLDLKKGNLRVSTIPSKDPSSLPTTFEFNGCIKINKFD